MVQRETYTSDVKPWTFHHTLRMGSVYTLSTFLYFIFKINIKHVNQVMGANIVKSNGSIIFYYDRSMMDLCGRPKQKYLSKLNILYQAEFTKAISCN